MQPSWAWWGSPSFGKCWRRDHALRLQKRRREYARGLALLHAPLAHSTRITGMLIIGIVTDTAWMGTRTVFQN